MKVLVFLQNAWSPVYAGKKWPRKQWLAALKKSRSGQRLRILESKTKEVEWYYANASPVVGAHPDSRHSADIYHMRKVSEKQNPDVIVALGKEAQNGAAKAFVHHNLVIFAPHPASRVLTNDLYSDISNNIRRLESGWKKCHEWCNWVFYVQERGCFSRRPEQWTVVK